MSTVLRIIKGEFPGRMNQDRAVLLHRVSAPGHRPPAGSAGDGPYGGGGGGFGGGGSSGGGWGDGGGQYLPAFINAETKIRIWLRVSDSGQHERIHTIRHGALKLMLLPYYHGDEGLYLARVTVHHASLGIRRTIPLLTERDSSHPNTVNIVFVDWESQQQYLSGWDANAYRDGEPVLDESYESDIANARQRLETTHNPEVVRGKVFALQDEHHGDPRDYDWGNDILSSRVCKQWLKSVELGIGDYAPPLGMADYLHQFQFEYDVEHGKPEGYYAAKVFDYLRSVRSNIINPNVPVVAGTPNEVFRTEFDHPDGGFALDDWSHLWGFDEWGISSIQDNHIGDNVLRSERSASGANAIGYDPIGSLEDGEITTLVKPGEDYEAGTGGGFNYQNQLIARAAGDGGSKGYFVRLANIDGWSDSVGWNPYPDYMREANFDGKFLEIVRISGTSHIVIGRYPFPWEPDHWYWMKFRFKGITLSAKAWERTDLEPEWMVNVRDGEFQIGRVGVGRTGHGNQLWDTFFVSVLEELPASPTTFTGTADGSSIAFSWDPVEDGDGYNVYLNGQKQNEELLQETSYLLEELATAVHSVYVTAVRGIFEGASSDIIQITITGDAPTGFKVEIVDSPVSSPENFTVEIVEDFTQAPENFTVELVEDFTKAPEDFQIELIDGVPKPSGFQVEGIDNAPAAEGFQVELIDNTSLIPVNFDLEQVEGISLVPQDFDIGQVDEDVLIPQNFQVEQV